MTRTRTEPPTGVRVGPTPPKGRGVLATRPIQRAEVVESAPVFVIPGDEQKLVHATLLNDYVFGWGTTIAVVLDCGSLYNHAWEPNLEYRKRLDDGLVDFVAVRDIPAGEELTVNYSSSSPESAFLWADLA